MFIGYERWLLIVSLSQIFFISKTDKLQNVYLFYSYKVKQTLFISVWPCTDYLSPGLLSVVTLLLTTNLDIPNQYLRNHDEKR